MFHELSRPILSSLCTIGKPFHSYTLIKAISEILLLSTDLGPTSPIVLIVDDDEFSLRVIDRIVCGAIRFVWVFIDWINLDDVGLSDLKSNTFNIKTEIARDGVEALAIYVSHKQDHFSLVITDLVSS